ncbi:pyridoxal phosphate-dependent aminotransferase [Candidatus Bathyarchaeota archaeon]|nr:pyridoxal phosphate-dependent aminotransferase [Candidatus Bathyarchaeota archaeon]
MLLSSMQVGEGAKGTIDEYGFHVSMCARSAGWRSEWVMPTVNDRIDLLHISPIRRVAALLAEARKQRDIISFGGGAPSLLPPQEVLDEMVRMLKDEPRAACSYVGTRGLMELRRLISDDFAKQEGTKYDPEKEVVITDGASEGVFALFMSLLGKGDEVIQTDPTYLGFREAAMLAGARVVTLPVTVDEGYQPGIEILKSLVTSETRAFVLLSPDNPTGRVVKEEFVKALVDLAVDHNFWIIYDATYRDILFEGTYLKICSLPGGRDHVAVTGSFSKAASIPGLRLGYVMGPPHVTDAVEKIKQYTSLAPNTLSQHGMIKFFSGDIKEKYLKQTVLPTYKARRDFMAECIKKELPEAKTSMPQGAFYFFVNLNYYLDRMRRDDGDFCNRLLERKSVVLVPGSYFGSKGAGHARVTFVSEPEERIEAGIRAVAEYVFSFTF